MHDIEIRQMNREEIAIVADYFLEAFGPDGLGEPWTKEKTVKHLEEVFNEKYSFVALFGGEIAGALVGLPNNIERGMVYWIDTIVVKKSLRGKGVGSALIKHAEMFAKKNNLAALDLLANPKLQSFEWYKELGFFESGWVNLTKTLV